MAEFEPTRASFRDDNYHRAQEIVSARPLLQNNYERRERYDYYERRHIRKHFSPAERAAILARVSVVGVKVAAREAGTSEKIIMSWLAGIDASIKTSQKQMQTHPQVVAPKEEEKKSEPEPEITPKIETVPSQVEIIETVETVENLESVENVDKTDTTEKTEKTEKTENVENVEAVEAVPQPNVLKHNEDFTYEEKVAIIEKAKIIGMTKAAREFNTTRWVIMNWADNLASKGKKQISFTDEEIQKILKHAEKVGIRQAARDFNTTRERITRWKKNYDVKPENNNIESENSELKKKIADVSGEISNLRERLRSL